MTSYKVVAIDVHKNMLAVVVADVGKDEWQFERRKFGTAASELKVLEEWLATRDGCEAAMEFDGAVWEARIAAIGRTLPAALGASTFESGAARPEARFRKRRATPATACGWRVDSQFRTTSGTAPVADIDPQQATVDAGPCAPA